MEFDVKTQVLLAIYVEYQKDLPQMETISAQALGLTMEMFAVAVEKLANEGLINLPEDNIKRGSIGSKASSIFLRGTMMNPKGIEFVEQKLVIDKTLSGKEKAQKVLESAGKWGLEQIMDLAAKVLAEMASNAIGL